MSFTRRLFAAVETYRLDSPDGGQVIKLSIEGAEFWLSGGAADNGDLKTGALGGGSVRMILTVSDPDAVFANAIRAGAKEVFPVTEEYGWKLGHIEDPFGLHWEIGHQLAE